MFLSYFRKKAGSPVWNGLTFHFFLLSIFHRERRPPSSSEWDHTSISVFISCLLPPFSHWGGLRFKRAVNSDLQPNKKKGERQKERRKKEEPEGGNQAERDSRAAAGDNHHLGNRGKTFSKGLRVGVLKREERKEEVGGWRRKMAGNGTKLLSPSRNNDIIISNYVITL